MELDVSASQASRQSMGGGWGGAAGGGGVGGAEEIGGVAEPFHEGTAAADVICSAVAHGAAEAVAWGLQLGWSCLVGIMKGQLMEPKGYEAGSADPELNRQIKYVGDREYDSALDALLGGEGQEVVEELWEVCVGSAQHLADVSAAFRGTLQEEGWVRGVFTAAQGAGTVDSDQGVAVGKRSRGAGVGRVESTAAEEVWREAVEFQLLVRSLLQQ
jgi:hypothetical protein